MCSKGKGHLRNRGFYAPIDDGCWLTLFINILAFDSDSGAYHVCEPVHPLSSPTTSQHRRDAELRCQQDGLHFLWRNLRTPLVSLAFLQLARSDCMEFCSQYRILIFLLGLPKERPYESSSSLWQRSTTCLGRQTLKRTSFCPLPLISQRSHGDNNSLPMSVEFFQENLANSIPNGRSSPFIGKADRSIS